MGLDVTRWSAPVEWLSGVGGMGRNTGMSARRRTKNSSGSGFAALLVLGAIAWVIMFIIRHIWVILGILVVVGSIYVAKAIVEDNRRRRDAYARYCADIATKADQQDNWVAAGDERGIYGGEPLTSCATSDPAGRHRRPRCQHRVSLSPSLSRQRGRRLRRR